MNGWSEQGLFTLFMRRKVGRSVLPLAQPKPAAAYCHLKSSSFFLLLAVFLLFSFIWLHSMLFKNSTQSDDNEYGTLHIFLFFVPNLFSSRFVILTSKPSYPPKLSWWKRRHIVVPHPLSTQPASRCTRRLSAGRSIIYDQLIRSLSYGS